MSELRHKPNPNNIPLIEERIGKIKAEIKELQELFFLVDSPGWKKVQELILRKSNAIENDLDGFEKYEDRELYALLQARIDHKNFLSMVDGTDKAIEALNKRLQEAESQLEELKGRLG